MKHAIIHVKGKEVIDMIQALDGGVLASLEIGDKERLAEAPDKSGGYNFKVYDEECSVPFEDLENNKKINELIQKIKSLEEENKELKNKLALTESEKENINSDYLELKETVSKQPVKPTRMRSY